MIVEYIRTHTVVIAVFRLEKNHACVIDTFKTSILNAHVCENSGEICDNLPENRGLQNQHCY